MKNQEIAKIFSNLAAYLYMEDIPFKPQAYERAAMALEALPADVQDIYKKEGFHGLESIAGVGKGIAARIEEYVKTGKVQDYEEYKKRMPVNLEELMLVEGMGPKMVRDLYKHLKIKNLRDLEKAAKAGKIRDLPNFGEKTEQNILESIVFVKRSHGRRLLGDIYPHVEELISLLKSSGLAKEAVAAGSIRRMKETVGDVDLLVTTKKPKEVIDYFLSHVPSEKLWGRGPTKISLRTSQGFDIDVRVLQEDVFGAGLQYFTGSKEHNVQLRTYASSLGFKVSEYGVFKGNKRIACKTEEEVYKVLGMPYIEPELREDQGEIEAALRQAQGKLPGLPNLIPYNSLRGDLQIQTDWTDGKNSIFEMAQAAKKQGLEYIAITDHTKDLAMTGGSDEKKLIRQMAEIDRVQKKISGITILKGAEVNIRKDGTLDIADEVLSQLDVVGASVHSSFKMTKKDMTERVVRAMRNSNVDILFHPTGRSMPKRDAYDVDMESVIKEAKKTGTVLEINAQPRRLDLKDVHIRQAKEVGISMAIDSDAHNVEHFKFLKYGIAQARRGWAEARDVVNTLPLEKCLKMFKNNKTAD
ncbi:MAG: DNA polymerase/3'-5' exonuclease PolX [Candidatus Wildermuthbacteria bacterium]|nr:DNA polymerase/3'-5' exonuclease PolX [Candidatus Wildermuthbacteria bacterium]